ncbi:hypothetical protein M568_19185 [Salmonella enterica subsp. enterica serovar Namur str. 05-2929]|uniref:Uncharacterized protein n=1 Tax=Salmonella enterica I TaxID=59201 RepID=A0A3S5DD75_SALET|nr:hypothetical protein M568_19185 [Salmonella enterica subsp. enterica serovar Namur str. 05-2929]VEA39086.1 Uncharacterised protein [Salmonella enterica subsp. enterica]
MLFVFIIIRVKMDITELWGQAQFKQKIPALEEKDQFRENLKVYTSLHYLLRN